MKRTKKSEKKTKFLLILLVLTAILSITATYAWFSSQRDVEITGIKLNVEVAESMQISLDGETWVQTITIDNMRQFYGTYSDSTLPHAKSDDNTNYVPTELLPVSTVGSVSAGKLQFMTGEATMGTDSTSVTATACSEADLLTTATVDARQGGNDSHPYLVFDMYLRNYSSKDAGDNLQLNSGSRVWVDDDSSNSSQEGTGVEGTGLENCARVGFVIYENTTPATSSGATARALTSTDAGASVVIWEPNDLEHIDEVVNSGRAAASTTSTTYGVKYSATSVTIDDVDSTTDTKLAQQYTMKPAYNTSTGTTEAVNMATSAESPAEVKLAKNTITKIRVYIWLEGQDVDCINAASYGDRLQATIKLTKPENEDGTSNTYTGDGSST